MILVIVAIYLNIRAFDPGVLLAFLDQLGYIVTYASLLVCLGTVVATFVWYPAVRRKFSSPIGHSGLSVLKLLLVTAILIIVVQVGLLLFYPDALYHVSFYLFLISVLMFAVRNAVTFGGAYLHKRRESRASGSSGAGTTPLVTVVVPAYNEENALGKTIEALLRLSYAQMEIIIDDDGSTDGTLDVARRFANNNSVNVVAKPNGGKWDALNAGINVAKGEFVVCIDADTLLDRDAIQHLMRHFADPGIGAVAGNVKVGNRRGLLTKLQALEYVVGINLHRRSEAHLRKVTVVPGPIGAFRASVLKEVGLFKGDTFAEDADMTFRILKAGYNTAFEARAIGYTEAPNTMDRLAKQRYRWYRGSLQVLSKHKDLTFSKKHGRTGTFVMPWTIFNGVVYPWFMFFTLMWLLVFCFNPVSPYTVYQPRLRGPAAGVPSQSPPTHGQGPPSGPAQTIIMLDFFQTIPYIYVFWFLAFALLEIATAAYALSLDIREKPQLLLYTVFHRLSYVYVVDILRMLSQLEEVFHYPMRWELMEHEGTASIQQA